jgi:peptide/nickel transport system substrate-binding protein
VRKALAHTADRAGVNEVAAGGNLTLADTMFQPGEDFGLDAARGAVTYPVDPRRSEQLMNEAGFSKGADGFYSDANGRFSANLAAAYAAGFDQEIFILGDSWRKAGFDIQETVVPAAQAQDAQIGATFTGMSSRTTRSGGSGLVGYTTSAIPSADNRWVGQNRGGWSNPEMDRLVERFNLTLDRHERAQEVESIARIFTSELPAIPLYFNFNAIAYADGLRGMQAVPAGGNQLSNIHEWEFR